jgi:molybdopterin synthase catalytic subunit
VSQTSQAVRPVVRLVDIRDTDLQVDEVVAAVSDAAAGGLTLFVGAVRDHDEN